jgi:TolA-binding protein
MIAMLAALLLSSVAGHESSAQARSPVIQNRVRLNPGQPVGFHVLMVPDTVYVGQQATYEMGVFISESAQARMRRNPEVVPAELRGVLAYDLGGPQSLAALQVGGQRMFPHVLQRALFPLASGLVTIPASQLTYALPRSSSYFSREESAVVRADAVTLFAKPLPTEGQPDAFSGTVGQVNLSSSVDLKSARVGETVVLTVRVGGRGNVKLWPRPTVQATSASLVPAGERIRVDTTGQYVRGTKEFDWLVTPEREGRLVIPVVKYPYFDPYAEEYRVATADSLELPVSRGQIIADNETDAERNVLPIRRTDRGELGAPLASQPLFWALIALMPVPAIVVRRKRSSAAREVVVESSPEDRAVRRTITTPTSANPTRVAAASLRRKLLDQLAERLDTTSPMLAERRVLQQRLRRRGVTRETTRDVMSLIDELDEAAWSASGTPSAAIERDAPTWTERLRALVVRVHDEAMPARTPFGEAGTASPSGATRATRAPTRSPNTPVLFAALAPGALLVGGAQLLAARADTFDAAVAQYDAGAYADASESFLALANVSPRNADAWANTGTSAWAAHDSVTAVVGWQRALRLEPTALDLRARLELHSALARDGEASVPQVGRQTPTVVALALWCTGWAVLAIVFAVARRRAGGVFDEYEGLTRVMAVALLVGAAGSAFWQWQLSSQLDNPAIAVVTQFEPLRVSPSADADLRGNTERGDVVVRAETRVDAERGETWVSVTHSDGRLGWLPARALRGLGTD